MLSATLNIGDFGEIFQKMNQGISAEKYFISFKDKSKQRWFVIENGSFFLLEKTDITHLTDKDVVKILFCISSKKYKVNGHGYYSKSIVN